MAARVRTCSSRSRSSVGLSDLHFATDDDLQMLCSAFRYRRRRKPSKWREPLVRGVRRWTLKWVSHLGLSAGFERNGASSPAAPSRLFTVPRFVHLPFFLLPASVAGRRRLGSENAGPRPCMPRPVAVRASNATEVVSTGWLSVDRSRRGFVWSPLCLGPKWSCVCRVVDKRRILSQASFVLHQCLQPLPIKAQMAAAHWPCLCAPLAVAACVVAPHLLRSACSCAPHMLPLA